MGNMFATIANKATTLSNLMVNREKISTDDIVGNYPDGITINAFDIVNISVDSFPVFTFKEDDSKFAFGGAILSNIVDSWVEQFDGDILAASNALNDAGGVRIKFVKSRTKSGNNITLVKVIED